MIRKLIIMVAGVNVAVCLMIASAGPASALPSSSVHGAAVAKIAVLMQQGRPPLDPDWDEHKDLNPVLGPLHGERVSLVARLTSTGSCSPFDDHCPNP